MKSAVDAWKLNLRNKVEELRTLVLKYLTTRDDQQADEISHRVTGLKLMFSDNQIPQALRVLEGAIAQFRQTKNHPPYFLGMMRAYDSLGSVATFAEEQLPSFDDIFASYKADADLSSLVNELVALLERILSEADDLLTAHIARELKIILEQLKARDRRSLYELQSWVDLSIRALIMVTETYTGTHGIALVYEAAKIAFRVKRRLLDHYVAAQKQLIEAYQLSYVQKAVDRIPEMSSEEEVRKFLDAPKTTPT